MKKRKNSDISDIERFYQIKKPVAVILDDIETEKKIYVARQNASVLKLRRLMLQ